MRPCARLTVSLSVVFSGDMFPVFLTCPYSLWVCVYPCVQVPGAAIEEGNDAEQLSEAAMATAMAVIDFARVVEGAGMDQLKALTKVGHMQGDACG